MAWSIEVKRNKGTASAAALASLLVIAAVVLLPGCGGKKEERVVRMGYLRNDLHQLAYYVATEKGFFTDEGVDVREGGAFNAGPEEMSAFSAGALDMGYVGTAPAVTFAAQRMADIKIVAQANQEGSAIVVRPGIEGEDVAALNGRTVAVPGFSTVQDFLLRTALKKARMKPTDVNETTLKPPEMVQALSAGQIDAFVAWEPYVSQAVSQKSGRVLVSSHRIWPHHPCCALVADSKFEKEYPDLVKRVVAAHVKATKYINDNMLEAIDMAHLFTGQPRDVVKPAMSNLEYTYVPDVAGVRRYVVFMKEVGAIKVKDPAGFTRELVDTRFLPGVNKS